jgi:proline dehydrogenase
MSRLVVSARRLAAKCLLPLARRAAKAYVAGERLEDAIALADRLAERGLGATLGFWDSPDDSPRLVADAYLAGIEALAGREHAYLSIKVPSLGFSSELMAEIVGQAERDRVRLHFDSLAPHTADACRALFEQFLSGGANLSYTLPGRWARSVEDAAWATAHDVVVRVV